ncbi:NAC domain-containing protein 8 [Phtheirospermum japonicum]|uniref:NAC domain-containing protein 8 n=1 Tax=Phtheirospermum japonicum TaxID=374723 RepID=A0A830D2N8_9LAMI|nr:NAC domain-containing protein 8 [Phtheirospermum japonicum]
MAQNGQNPARFDNIRRHQRLQENPRPLHKLRPTTKAREDQLGHAPIPLGRQRRGERRRIGRLKSVLPNTA